MSRDQPAGAMDRVKSLALYPLPHHAVSRLVGRVTRMRTRWVRDVLIRTFVRAFGVDLADAEGDVPGDWPDFNAFFTRALRPGTRPLPDDGAAIASPVDGTVSEAGHIAAGELIQAKGQRFGLRALLGGDAELAERFRDGAWATLYLSPRDYHRVHMPGDGRPSAMIHVPGRLFSVAPHTVRAVPGLFARNERVVCLFDGADGPFAVILVGAICVASIETVWHGVVTPPAGRRVRAWHYRNAALLERGAEMGRFNMGSTAILLYPRGRVDWATDLRPGRHLRMGEAIGRHL
ncbi:archaetidylserine decarboxylase [Arhodomonas aquaeolei]|uniref:archaetidylserine decarboxylase n=1 Tax=Arhodomonas aquaeolei TaxID=2369 RepID=UPI00037B4964|nr:archaetidylserine decarboxylase [Arhodomonas aquaeolei]